METSWEPTKRTVPLPGLNAPVGTTENPAETESVLAPRAMAPP